MEAIIPFLVVIGVFVSWVVNLNKQNELKQRRQERQRQLRERAGGRGRKNANDFMNEGNRREQAISDVEFVDEDDVEIVEEAPRRRPPRSRSRKRSRDDVWREQTGQASSKPQSPAKPVSPPPVTFLQERHVETSIREVPRAEISGLTAQHLSSSIDTRVQQDLGIFTGVSESSSGSRAQSETTRRRAAPSSALRLMLRNPESVRQAIVMSEILSKPVALRK
ncbi:MAG: hypothetical protein KDA58_09900 [Planctomycetaceae bacterium]|nr:hypothetical protein [Planctomycetaceae bacterium]